jgi:hypothetical protein
MPQGIKELYQSANGDRWSLIRDGGKVLVLHEPNRPSGGTPSRIEIGDFLLRNPQGPEQAELLRLIGTLADAIDEAGSPL